MKMVVRLVLLLALAFPALSQTQIVDTLYTSDSTPFNGTLRLSWRPFVTADGHAVAAGSRTLTIASGVINIALWPTQGAAPATSYIVETRQGTQFIDRELWGVPTSSPATLASVRGAVYSGTVATGAFTGPALAAMFSGTRPCYLYTDGTTATCVTGSGGAGISSLNALTGSTQTFAVGTTGTDFTISSSGTVHTFNFPTASSTKRGLLSTTDWTLFNAKEPPVAPGTSPDYYRGDKTWQPLSTAVLAAMSGLYEAPLTFTAPLNRTTNTIACDTATGSLAGCLSAADWTIFNGKQATLGFTPLSPANNLSELASAATARTNLGLGTAATQASSAFLAAGGTAVAATALAANGANCSAGSFPLGVDASGASESCTALPTTIAGTANQIAASGATGAVILSIPNSPTLPGTTTGTFLGNITGNVTGNATGSSGSTTGNAATASSLASTPSLCGTGNAPTGILANGDATGCASLSGGGTVTTLSVASTNGFAGSVATATTTPVVTLSTTITGVLKGNGTAISAASAGTDYVVPAGNTATATALASTPTTCSAGSAPRGVNASGNAVNCAVQVQKWTGSGAPGTFSGAIQGDLYFDTGNAALPVYVCLNAAGCGVAADWSTGLAAAAFTGPSGTALILQGAEIAKPTTTPNCVSGTDTIYFDSTDHIAFQINGSCAVTAVMVAPATATANQFLTNISSHGAQVKAQPAFTDISGAATRAQGGLNSSSAGTGILRDGTTPAASELSGDVSTSGSNAVIVAKVNAVAYPASPSVHQVPVVTASGTVTYKTVPDCTDTGGNHLNYTQSTDAFSCGTSGDGTGSGSGGGLVTYSAPSITLAAGTTYFPFGGGGLPSSTESNSQTLYRVAGTVANLAISTSAALGVGNQIVWTIRDNTADTTVTCTQGNATSCSDTTHSFNTVAGHLYDVKAVITGTIVGTPMVMMVASFGTSSVGITSVFGSTGPTVGAVGDIGATGNVIGTNGGTLPVSATVVGTNSSSQIILTTSATTKTNNAIVQAGATGYINSTFTTPVAFFSPDDVSLSSVNGMAFSVANTARYYAFTLPYPLVFSTITVNIKTIDNTALYDIAIYDSPGTGGGTANLLAHSGAVANFNSTGQKTITMLSAPFTLAPGRYNFVACAPATTAMVLSAGNGGGAATIPIAITTATGTAPSGGTCPSTITVAADSWTTGNVPYIVLR